MTSIEISGARETLEELSFVIDEALHKNGVKGKISLQETRLDSVDTSVLTVLQVTFSGVIAVVQVITLILKVQENRRNSNSEEAKPLFLTVEVGNGSKLELKIPEIVTNEEINTYINIVQRFSNELLGSHDKQFLNTFKNGEIALDMAKINHLFEDLLIKTQRIRKQQSTVIKNEVSLTVTIEMIEANLLDLLRKEENRFDFYLPVKDIEACQATFFSFESENILDFQQISHEIKMIDMQNVFVKYEVEKLTLFWKIIQNQEFRFYAAFR